MQKEIELNQKAWLKTCLDMSNIILRTKVKKYFEKDFLKLMTSSIFGRTMQNLKNHRDIRLVATEKRRSCLVTNVSEPNYHTAKCFSETPLETEMDKTKRNE